MLEVTHNGLWPAGWQVFMFCMPGGVKAYMKFEFDSQGSVQFVVVAGIFYLSLALFLSLSCSLSFFLFLSCSLLLSLSRSLSPHPPRPPRSPSLSLSYLFLFFFLFLKQLLYK